MGPIKWDVFEVILQSRFALRSHLLNNFFLDLVDMLLYE